MRNRRYAKTEPMPCGREIWQATTFSGEQRAVKVAIGSYDEVLHQELAKARPSELLQGLDAALNFSCCISTGCHPAARGLHGGDAAVPPQLQPEYTECAAPQPTRHLAHLGRLSRRMGCRCQHPVAG